MTTTSKKPEGINLEREVRTSPFMYARPEYHMSIMDEIEGDDFIIFVPNDIESVPADVVINTGEYTWNCYLFSVSLTHVRPTPHSKKEIYKCRYRKY